MIDATARNRLPGSGGDDVPEGKGTSFPMAVQRKDDETMVFPWVVWPSKEARKAGWDKIMADHRMQPDKNPIRSTASA
jgi:uncharacterized protein YbaA (DUF1428 family)